MPQYLLSIYQPDDGVPDAETVARFTAGLHRLNQELRESGSWVFTGGLHGRSGPHHRRIRASRDGSVGLRGAL